MKKTFVDVMLELPVDATLRDFLTTHSLPVPDGFAWDDTPETSQFLVEAVKVWPDIAARDRMRSEEHTSASHQKISYAVFCLKKKKRPRGIAAGGSWGSNRRGVPRQQTLTS